MAKDKHVVVIGAGPAGLAAGFYLARSGYKVTLVEKDGSVGGASSGFDFHGYSLEKLYHHVYLNDRYFLKFARMLGGNDNLSYFRSRTGCCRGGRFYNFTNPVDLLRFTPLSFADRLKFGAMALRARRVVDWRSLDRHSAKEWILKSAGAGVYRTLWGPLLEGKFKEGAEDVSAAWLWNKLVSRGASRDFFDREVVGYYKGGFQLLWDLAARKILEYGGAVKTGVEAAGIAVTGGRARAVVTSGGEIPADFIVSTVAAPVLAGILKGRLEEGDFMAALRSVKYYACICLLLSLKVRLTPFYWTNMLDGASPFIGLIEHTNLIPPEVYGGRHIAYLPCYIPNEGLSSFDIEAHKIASFRYLQQLFPHLLDDGIGECRVFKADYGQPFCARGYLEVLGKLKDPPLRDFAMTSTAMIYPEDRGINCAIREGERIFLKVDAALR